MNAQADRTLRWKHTSDGTFSDDTAHLLLTLIQTDTQRKKIDEMLRNVCPRGTLCLMDLNIVYHTCKRFSDALAL